MNKPINKSVFILVMALLALFVPLLPAATTTAMPSMSLPSGDYYAPITVSISSSTPSAVIHYTLDNSEPTTNSPKYVKPLTFSIITSLRAMAAAPGLNASAPLHKMYTFVVPTPTITPSSGSHQTAQLIAISDSLTGSVIVYTKDGTIPTINSIRYTGSFLFAKTGKMTIQAMAIKSGHLQSAVRRVDISLSLPAEVIVNTAVDSTSGLPIRSDFLGFSHAWKKAATMMGTNALGVNDIYRTMIRHLGGRMNGPLVLRIGGNDADSSGSATPSTVEAFTELAKDVNVKYILGVNLGSNNLSLAEEQASVFTSNVPSNLLSAIEIGNEPDGYNANGLRPSNYSYGDFLSQYQQWSKGIGSSSAFAVPIAGPTFGTGNWMSNAEGDVGGALKASIVTQHKYIACYYASNPLPSDLLLQPSSSNASMWAMHPYGAAVHQAKSLFRMDEMNSICNGGQKGVSDTFSSALWAIDTMFEYISNGIDGVNWNTSYDGGPYDLFQFNIWNHNGLNDYSLTRVRPLYYGLLFFSEAGGHSAQLLPTRTLTDSNMKVWVTAHSGGNKTIVIINKEQSIAGTVQVTLPGYSRGTVMRLTASNYLATSGVSIWGQTFDGSTDGNLVGPIVTETTYPSGGVWKVSVKPMSAVIVNLQ